ncbi:2Fe-2S iron-sulfur cluster-binding protein [Arthrobacter mobilis]|uniref:2Fe-2S iron-sulfur cluster binding domain-containing protein n=1 Tax=Arthrobacter mobilis TaxID=2724944 RepID=A0A7X6HF44_9MICC|nr:2Fe-2S iron-sulfur cluster-binding protein [Arthrobacter mobilis]NKX55916.1 2Fe-2S iron-sulfur cluster binding domain-containing protein [Arthrobacter mobilis]
MPTITFVDPHGIEHDVEGDVGQSLMTVAVNHDIPGIEGECGGEMACGTCHVYVADTAGCVPPPRTTDEAEMLEVLIDGVKPTSRLGCQIRVGPELDGLSVTVPSE